MQTIPVWLYPLAVLFALCFAVFFVSAIILWWRFMSATTDEDFVWENAGRTNSKFGKFTLDPRNRPYVIACGVAWAVGFLAGLALFVVDGLARSG